MKGIDPNTRYDLHPIIRRYAYERLTERSATHSKLAGYFEAIPKPVKIETLADLEPVIELFHHLARAGKYDEAFTLFSDRLNTPLYYQLGAYQKIIELLLALWLDGKDELPQLKAESDQTWTLDALAASYGQAGHPNEAIPIIKLSNNLNEKQNDKVGLSIGLGSLARLQIVTGDLASAEANLRRAIEIDREIYDRFEEGANRREFGLLLAYRGDWNGSVTELDMALDQLTTEEALQSQGLVWAYRTLGALMQGNNEMAEKFAREALRLTNDFARIEFPVERDYVRAYWLLGWTSLVNNNLAGARQYLDEALQRCRAINNIELESAILLAQARLTYAQHSRQMAFHFAVEAWLIAERANYLLHLADIHNFLAQLALDTGDRPTARQHAAKAKEYAWCDGPPYAYQVALDEAEWLLAEIG